MSYMTLTQICDLTGKSKSAVRRALKRSGTKLETFPGARGYRIPESVAVRFIARQWPEALKKGRPA